MIKVGTIGDDGAIAFSETHGALVNRSFGFSTDFHKRSQNQPNDTSKSRPCNPSITNDHRFYQTFLPLNYHCATAYRRSKSR